MPLHDLGSSRHARSVRRSSGHRRAHARCLRMDRHIRCNLAHLATFVRSRRRHRRCRSRCQQRPGTRRHCYDRSGSSRSPAAQRTRDAGTDARSCTGAGSCTDAGADACPDASARAASDDPGSGTRADADTGACSRAATARPSTGAEDDRAFRGDQRRARQLPGRHLQAEGLRRPHDQRDSVHTRALPRPDGG